MTVPGDQRPSAGLARAPGTRVNHVLLRVVRWTSWPLLLLILAFLFTGYSISGQFGLGRVMEEKEALALHKMLHWPLIVLVLVHAAPAVYLAFVRWGWFKRRHKP